LSDFFIILLLVAAAGLFGEGLVGIGLATAGGGGLDLQLLR
jgi:hypothetical protein